MEGTEECQDSETMRPLDKVATGSYHLDMRAVGIKILKNKLSEYVRLAASGETILVTDHDRVVAEITPPKADRGSTAAKAWWADAMSKGWITPALLHSPLSSPLPPVTTFEQLMRELDADREDR
jgi:antitoxin (DNA-binding transcriptional repressor) of toxin-antitoxin stability system